MELDRLIDFAKTYDRLGWAIQQQVDDILQGNTDDINPNALREIDKQLRGFNEDLDAAIDAAVEVGLEVK